MLQRNRHILIGAAAVLGVWLALYYAVLVQPNWSARDEAVADAQQQIDKWVAQYKPKEGHVALPEASRELEKAEAVLTGAEAGLKNVFFAPDMKGFELGAAGNEDPNLFFSKKRSEVLEEARSQRGIRLGPGWDDLGFREKINEQPVGLNLARLLMVKRFFRVAQSCKIAEILELKYPKHMTIPYDAGEEVKVEKLYQVPFEVRFRTTERYFGQVLAEVQRPSNAERSYFALRGFSIEVKDAESGMVDGWLALAGLFPESQVKALDFVIEEAERPSGYERPTIDPSRY